VMRPIRHIGPIGPITIYAASGRHSKSPVTCLQTCFGSCSPR
jgi:hypothetical protein